MLFSTIILTIVFLAIIFSKFIVNQEVQPIYWMIMLLLVISISNIYMSIHFYIKLRNEPGVKGERGDPGIQGEQGSKGQCVINTQCDSIELCDEFIKTHLITHLPEYKRVLDKQDKSQVLNKKDRSILSQIQQYTEILKPKCKSGKYSKEEMSKLIEKSFSS
jgi:hypothetical protein